jgi:DNA-binding XRE family transcriptional regulator
MINDHLELIVVLAEAREGLGMDVDPRDSHLLDVVATNLRAARARRKISQSDLAFASGIKHQSLISEIENGRPALLPVYGRLARALEIPLTDLFEDLDVDR